MWLLMIQSSQQWHSYYQSLQFTSDLGKSGEIFQKPQTLFVFTWLFIISIQFDCSIFISTSERYTSHTHRRTANKMVCWIIFRSSVIKLTIDSWRWNLRFILREFIFIKIKFIMRLVNKLKAGAPLCLAQLGSTHQSTIG